MSGIKLLCFGEIHQLHVLEGEIYLEDHFAYEIETAKNFMELGAEITTPCIKASILWQQAKVDFICNSGFIISDNLAILIYLAWIEWVASYVYLPSKGLNIIKKAIAAIRNTITTGKYQRQYLNTFFREGENQHSDMWTLRGMTPPYNTDTNLHRKIWNILLYLRSIVDYRENMKIMKLIESETPGYKEYIKEIKAKSHRGLSQKESDDLMFEIRLKKEPPLPECPNVFNAVKEALLEAEFNAGVGYLEDAQSMADELLANVFVATMDKFGDRF